MFLRTHVDDSAVVRAFRRARRGESCSSLLRDFWPWRQESPAAQKALESPEVVVAGDRVTPDSRQEAAKRASCTKEGWASAVHPSRVASVARNLPTALRPGTRSLQTSHAQLCSLPIDRHALMTLRYARHEWGARCVGAHPAKRSTIGSSLRPASSGAEPLAARRRRKPARHPSDWQTRLNRPLHRCRTPAQLHSPVP